MTDTEHESLTRTGDRPLEELERLVDRMSRQFDDAAQLWNSDGPLSRWTPEADSMAIDLADRDGEFVVTADLPGFESDDIDIRVTDRTLRIEADREHVHDEHREDYLRHERRHESSQRSVRLPERVDKADATATLAHGVLRVRLPKRETEQPHSIRISPD